MIDPDRARVLDHHRLHRRAAFLRERDPAFADWAAGVGVITHADATQVRVHKLVERLRLSRAVPDAEIAYQRLRAADRLANAAMWLVVHLTYARRVRLDGGELGPEDFKVKPQGHTGGALNMVPAYVGYLAANALTGHTRAWLMGQGHCVAAIDASNLLVGNALPEHAERYPLSDDGLTRLARDFYGYRIAPDGRPLAPLGSHVNAHTAGGILEGGYLGFAELRYPHMPLPGERLVTFLSDGAFEEQRGGDWAPRWWRASDCGLVSPIMIANGRRIDQRSSMAQSGGTEWFEGHLRQHAFDPLPFDGTDPAAFAAAIVFMEERLTATGRAAEAGEVAYPVPLPYGIAEAPKGAGFPGAGSNAAHNLPLPGSPATDAEARELFLHGSRALHVPLADIEAAAASLATHATHKRVRERDHPLAVRPAPTCALPPPAWHAEDGPASPMRALDAEMERILDANPQLRPRVGNPDEMRSTTLASVSPEFTADRGWRPVEATCDLSNAAFCLVKRIDLATLLGGELLVRHAFPSVSFQRGRTSGHRWGQRNGCCTSSVNPGTKTQQPVTASKPWGSLRSRCPQGILAVTLSPGGPKAPRHPPQGAFRHPAKPAACDGRPVRHRPRQSQT